MRALRVLPLIVILVAGAREAGAQLATCHALIALDYVSGPNFPGPGDTLRIRVTLGSGIIQNGTSVTLSRIRFDLDCATPPAPGAVPCVDDGSVVAYGGDASITTDCGVDFTTGHDAGDTP